LAFLLQIDEQFAQENHLYTESGAFLQVSLFTDPVTWNPGYIERGVARNAILRSILARYLGFHNRFTQSRWLYGQVVTTAFAGIQLAGILPGKVQLFGFGYGMLVSVLMVAIFRLGEQVNFRQLTAQCAARISQALTAYHLQAGHYTQVPGQLIPLYLIAIPRPVIMFTQVDWCYQAAFEAYRTQYPNWDNTLLEYGQPVPTPDIRGFMAPVK
jgi:hypothetical protein